MVRAKVKETRVLVLGPGMGIQGPIPLLVHLLIDALVAMGYDVDFGQWGPRRNRESFFARVRGRVRQALLARQALRSKGYDLVFVESSHSLRGLLRDLLLLIAIRNRARKVIVQSHGSDLTSALSPGHIMFKAASRLRFSMADANIYSSTEEVRALARMGPNHRFYVADNICPAQTEHEGPSCELLRDMRQIPRPRVLFAARLIKDKGIIDLLDAMPIVLKEVDCDLLVAGIGPLENLVRGRANKEPLSGRTTLLGYLSRADLLEAMRLSSVFVLPTYHNEGFPQTVQEALGVGLPIVTVATRGLADHLEDGIHGRLIPARDAEALASAIIYVLKNEPVGGRMSRNCSAKAADFSASVVGKQYDRIFQAVIANRFD